MMTNVLAKRIFKAHENRGLVLSIAAASLLLGLVGCGAPGSDPTAAYSDLNATVVPHSETARDQKIQIAGAYSIDQELQATMVEGELQSVKLTVRFGQPGVTSYELKLSKVPVDATGMTLTKSDEANVFMLNWTAPKGTVSSSAISKQISYQVEISNVRAVDPAVEQLINRVERTKDLAFNVVRSGKRPEIVNETLAGSVSQGSITSFTVDVADPSSSTDSPPRLDVFFQGTNKTSDGFRANGATYVRVDSAPKNIGNGLWRFSFLFDAKNNDVGAQLNENGGRVAGATALQTRLFLKAFSASNLPAVGEKMKNVEIKYAKPQVEVVRDCPVVAPVASETTNAKPAAAKPKSSAVKSTATKATTTKPTAAKVAPKTAPTLAKK